ncbi:MAG: hypothetical protein SWY16_11425, partial [Cyanobacteriota bacterium]|nr:hypothetical protein [Cyanobacteriota bacterium]
MTESPNSPPTNEPNPRKRFGRVKIAIGILLLTGVGGGIAWGWWFVDRELVPLVTRELSKTLKRPVKIGEIESISLGSIQAGKSAIPATTTDPDSVEMEGVRVRFNLLKFLWSRKLDLDVLLLEPTAYLERDADGAWVSTEIAEGEGEGAIQVILNRIALEKGTVTLSDPEIDIAWAEREAQEQAEEDAEETEADTTENTETEDTEDTEETELELPVLPPPPSETTFKRVDSSVEFLDEGDRLKFEATGYPTTGRTRVRGEYLASKSALKLNVSGQNLPAGEASILVDLPVTIATGKINTNLNVELQTGGSSVPPNLEGNLRFEEIDAQIDNVPQPIVQGDGQLRFAGSLIQIEETQANYGLLPVAIPQGLMDLTQGYEIPIQVLPTDLAQYLATLQLESPVEISGEAEAILQIVGPIDTPVLIGETQTTDITTIDRIPFGDLSAQFALSTADGQIAIENIQATSDVGGSIQGKVLVQLPTQDNPDPSQGLPAAPENTPQENTPQIEENGASPLPQLDDATPPPTENSEVEENPDSPAPQLENPTPNEPAAEEKSDRPVQKFEVDENSPLAPFATDGEIPNSENLEPDADLDLETVEPRDLELEDIEPGNPEPNIREPETASENPTPASPETDAETEPQPLIEGEFLALDMPGEAIAQLYDANLPPGIAIGTVDARAIVLGPADDLQTLVQWEALSGTYPAKGEIEILPAGLRFQNTLVQVADSIVQAGGILVGDRWQAEFLLDQTPLNALLTPEQTQGFDLGTATGPIQIAGTLDAFDLASIEGLGQLDLTVGGGTVRAVGRLAQGQWAADVGLTDTAIASFLPPETTQGLNLGPATGQLEFAGSIDSFDLASIEGLGQLDLTVGGGTVRAVGRLAQGQWAADLGLTDTAIASFLPPETTQRLNLGPATGQLSLAGSIDSFDLAGIEGGGQLDLTVDGSNVRAVGGLSRGRWETTFELANTPITPFLPPNATQGLNLGPATGQISLGGTLDSFDLANIQGGGQLNLTVAGGDAIVAGELDAGR